MFNMLIAIMGDTFDKVTEHRDVNAIKCKLELMADLIAILPTTYDKGGDDPEIFFFMVQPEVDEDDDDGDDEWEGTIKTMSTVINKQKKLLKNKMLENSQNLEYAVDDFSTSGEAMDKSYKDYV